MTSTGAELVEIACTPGVEPYTDRTAFATEHYTFSDKIRFINGLPEKIGGWIVSPFANNALVDGYSRSLYSANIAGRIYTLIGTNSRLYSQIASTLTNITPLLEDTNAIPDSLDTHHATLASNPISVVTGSNVVTVADSEASLFQVGDTVTLSGATSVGGVLNTALNADHVIRSISGSTYTFRTALTAGSTTSGGGGSVVRTSGLLTVHAAAHDQLDGDRTKITEALDTGGILAAEINLELIIRNVTTNTFDVMTGGKSTFSVTSGGGSDTLYQKQIPIGLIDETFGQGYGMGLYGVGLYGVSKISTNLRKFPRIWYFDRFSDILLMTPGNQGGLYYWDGNNEIAPILVPGAPTAINYMFVSNSIVVTFGAGGVQNKIFASDQGDFTQWSSSSTNQVFEDNIEGAGRLLSHVNVNGTNLIFTNTQTYTFNYIGLPLIWQIESKEQNIGIIGSMARLAVNGVAYWMDVKNFYEWSGGNIEVIQSNTRERSTIHNYVYENITGSQQSKVFAWFDKAFNEFWVHYPSLSSLEPDRVARNNILEQTWVPDTMPRTAAEYPNISLINPRLMNIGIMYKHELGTDDNDQPMAFTLTTNKRTIGRNVANQDGFIPDSQQVGTIQFNVQGYQFPQSTVNTTNRTFDVTPTTERIPTTLSGRYWQDTWSGSELGQSWAMGKWQEYIQKGSMN